MSFKKLDDKLRFDDTQLKYLLTYVKKSKNGKRTNSIKRGAGKARALLDFLAREYLKFNTNSIKVDKQALREKLFLSSLELDAWINLCVDSNLLKVKELLGVNKLRIMINPAIYQYGYVNCYESLADKYHKLESQDIKRTRNNKTEKELQRIANNLKNAKPVATKKDNVIEVKFGN